MITNNQIKYVKSLHQKKFRQKYNKFIAEGNKIAQEILQNPVYDIEQVFASKAWIKENESKRPSIARLFVEVTPKDMKKISCLTSPAEVLFVLEKKSEEIDDRVVKDAPIILLDDVQDPGNVGTIIRLADWFGISTVIRTSNTADYYNPKVIQATMGSFLKINLVTIEDKSIKIDTHQYVTATMDGENISDFKWPIATCLVMGNESKGPSEEINKMTDKKITIQGDDNRVAESLNVGMAAGICCYEMMKGRK